MALKSAAAQMNIEGGNIGLCGNGQLDCSTGGDYVEIYDGKNAHSPLLGHVTGDITDDRTQVTLHAKTLHRTLQKRFRPPEMVSPPASKSTKSKRFRSRNHGKPLTVFVAAGGHLYLYRARYVRAVRD